MLIPPLVPQLPFCLKKPCGRSLSITWCATAAALLPRMIERAKGSYLYDRQGNKILDFTSGQMCATLGHNHPAVVQAIHKACEEVLHLFSGMLSPAVVEMADALCALLPPSCKKCCSSTPAAR
jgi:4-aminobutyrate aminotransferase-like enzyme